MAALLWQMTGPESAAHPTPADHVEHDARMRVSVRSLLRPIPAGDGTWEVAFFHRSVMEYFLAAAVSRALAADDQFRVREILTASQLSLETMEFVKQHHLIAGQQEAAGELLTEIALSARRDEVASPLGGNALSPCYLICETVPDADFRGLNLDGVRLVGADLHGRDLSGASMRYANFDNADLSGADLSGADLTGLRVEQTSQVTAVAIDPDAGTVLVAYDDGTIREWAMAGDTWSGRTALSGLTSPAQALVPLNSTVAVALTAHDALVLKRPPRQWTISCKSPRSPFVVGLAASGDAIWAVHSGARPLLAKWPSASDEVSLMAIPAGYPLVDAMYPLAPGSESDQIAMVSGEWMLSTFFVGGYLGPRLWHLPTGRAWDLPNIDITAFTVVAGTGDAPLLFVGTADGKLWHAPVHVGRVQLQSVAEEGHEGAITCVAAQDPSFIATGGIDRRVRIWQVTPEATLVTPLHLTLHCAGARFTGVQGDRERELLQGLADADPLGPAKTGPT